MMDKQKAQELGLQPVQAFIEAPEARADRISQQRKKNAERQARHREKLESEGFELVKLSPDDRHALAVGRAALAGAKPADPPAPPAAPAPARLSADDLEALQLGRRVQALGGLSRFIVGFFL